jgi:hypothetical protein
VVITGGSGVICTKGKYNFESRNVGEDEKITLNNQMLSESNSFTLACCQISPRNWNWMMAILTAAIAAVVRD